MLPRAAMLALLGVLGVVPDAGAQPAGDALPVPPTPPRIAQADEYNRCLDMLNHDPQGASSFAHNWAHHGGGDGAAHCQALAQIELGNIADGAEQLEHLAASSGAPAPARAMVYGQAEQAWMMANRPGRAYDAASLALALSPDDASLLIDRANAASFLDHYSSALADLTRALQIDPRRVDAYVLRSSVQRHLDQVDAAREDIDHALALDPDNAEALLERGILRQRDGDPVGAREDWQRAITLDPNSTTADLAQQNLALLEAGPKQ